jgi:ubiquinone/menaquinone biosynthesis C-methylase UbiE
VHKRTIEERATETGVEFRGAPYYDVAEKDIEWQWRDLIWPFISDADYSSALDLAAGHGRNSACLLKYAARLTIVDINDDNIEFCRRRFGNDPRIAYVVNDGLSLKEVAADSITLVYSFDSMVHFDSDVVRAYLREFRRILVPGGQAFIHHSNFTGRPGGNFTESPHWRNFMSRELLAHYAALEDLEIVRQQVIDWSVPNLDCLSLLRRPAP